MHAHERLGLGRGRAVHEREMHVLRELFAQCHQSEFTPCGRNRALGEGFNEPLGFAAVIDEIRNRADFQAVCLREGLQLGQPGHRAVVVHDLNEHARRGKACQPREIADGLGVPRAHQHAAVFGNEWKDMAGRDDIGGLGVGGARHAHGVGPVCGGNACRHARGGLDGGGEIGAVYGAVFAHHRAQGEPISMVLRDRHADESTAKFRHEIDGLGGHKWRGQNEIALIFPVFFVHQYDELSGLQIGNEFGNCVKRHAYGIKYRLNFDYCTAHNRSRTQQLMLIPVILCGGSGSRLWPASRDGFPKPFMTLPDGDTLIAKTVRRARAVAGNTPHAPILFVAGAQHSFLIRSALQQMGDTGAAHYVSEPMGRNTAPAVAIAALWAQQTHGANARLLILAADHLIADQAAFLRSVQQADAAAQTGALVTFGIAPTAPETGYGYLKQGEQRAESTFAVAQFVEKPPLDQAKTYLEAGNYAWNSGMFCFGAQTFLNEMEKSAPKVLSQSKTAFSAAKTTGSETSLDKETFALCESISVDYAVMEKAANVAMVRAAFDWSDVGAWPALAQTVAADAAGNRGANGHVCVDTKDSFIQSKRTVATIGVSNLLIIDTADALLVADASRAQDVKVVVDKLKASGSTLTQLHTTVHRPWGTYTILEDKDDCKVKRIVVYPGASLSLQLHHKRSEHWVVVTGTATITNGEAVLTMNPGEATFIPVGTKHRLQNKTNALVAIIETQVGTYFGEDDIVRLDDVYGRA